MTPPADWVAIGSPVGMQGVRFQVGDVLVDVGVSAFTDAKEVLLGEYTSSILVRADSTNSGPTGFSAETASNGRETVLATYAGSYPDFGTDIEGALAAQVDAGSGVGIVVNAFAVKGHLDDAKDALRIVVDTIEVGT